MKIKHVWLVVCLLGIMTGCSTPATQYEYIVKKPDSKWTEPTIVFIDQSKVFGDIILDITPELVDAIDRCNTDKAVIADFFENLDKTP